MFSKLLTPLDGSKTAEKVLPYVRYLAGKISVPVEMMAVVDVGDIATHMTAERARHLDTLIADTIRSSESYLNRIAGTFAGAKISTAVESGRPEEVIVEKAAADKNTLITMATHGHSGIDRWLLGSVAEKVLRSTTNPLLLVRARDDAAAAGPVTMSSVVVPLDGSNLAESVLPAAVELASRLNLEIVLVRVYNLPYDAYAGMEGYALRIDELLEGMKDEAREYLERKLEDVKKLGAGKVSYVLKEGFAPDEIISIAGKMPGALIAMSTHGRSGVRRWVLGSVTETVVRHSDRPVLVIRAADIKE